MAAGGESTLLLDVLPQTHRNLVLVFTGGHDGVAGLASHVLRFNSDGTASYYYARQEIDAAGTHTTNGNTGASGINTGGLSSGRGQIVLWVADYSMQQDAGSYLAVSWQAATRFGTATTANVFTSGGGFYNAGTGVPLESARLVLTSGDGFQADSRLAAYGVGAL